MNMSLCRPGDVDDMPLVACCAVSGGCVLANECGSPILYGPGIAEPGGTSELRVVNNACGACAVIGDDGTN